MTIRYVDSAAGSNTSPYDTWAKAATSLTTATAAMAAGDVTYVASTHSEAVAATTTVLSVGTATSPSFIICADKTSGEPPATLATGAVFEITGASHSLTLGAGSTGVYYFYGITFKTGSAQTTACRITSGAGVVAEKCQFICQTTNADNTAIVLPSGSGYWLNCDVQLGAAGQCVASSGAGFGGWYGGSLLGGGTSPTSFLNSSGVLCDVYNIDLTNAAAAVNLFTFTSTSGATTRFRRCKLPASWSGGLASASGLNCITEMVSCDSGATNYNYQRATRYGNIYDDTGVYLTATDGTTPISWKFVTVAASGAYPPGSLLGNEVSIWNDTVGSSVTITVEIVHDSVTGLKDTEFFFRVRYPGSSTSPLGSIVSSGAQVQSAGSTLTTSTASWTGTGGFTNTNKQKASVSFTPQQKGYLYVTPCLAKASKTLYVDPYVTLSGAGTVSRTAMGEGLSYRMEIAAAGGGAAGVRYRPNLSMG